MSTLKTKITKFPNNIFIFCILACTISWLGWFLNSAEGLSDFELLRTIGFIMGGGGPTLASVFYFALNKRKEKIPSLFQKIRPKGSFIWFLIAIFTNIMILIISIVLNKDDIRVLVGIVIKAGWIGLSVLFLKWFFSAIWEEYGWRGFLLEKMLKKYSANFSTLIVALSWAVWHIPLFFIQSAYVPVNFNLFLTSVLSESFWYSLIYIKQKRSILGVTIYHALANLTGELIILSGMDIKTYTIYRTIFSVAIGFIAFLILNRSK